MNLQTDYAFKRIFGSEKYKNVAIRFLNILFENEFNIRDIHFMNKELLRSDSEGKSIVYDVYCTNKEGRGEHFIIEMQNNYKPYWKNRTLFYIASAITGQGRRGWEYDMKPVFTIFIIDFPMEGMSELPVHDIRLADIKSHRVYTDDLRMLFLPLGNVKNEWEECDNDIEKLLYLIKNMENMDKKSKPYKDNFFEELFDAAEIGSLAAEDVVPYSQSLQRLRDDERDRKFLAEEYRAEGRAEGRVEGRAEGRVEGRAEGRFEGEQIAYLATAKRLLAMGLDILTISKATGLSEDQIAGLQPS